MLLPAILIRWIPVIGDVEDRHILTQKARFVGDAIAAVVAADELIAEKALKLIAVDI